MKEGRMCLLLLFLLQKRPARGQTLLTIQKSYFYFKTEKKKPQKVPRNILKSNILDVFFLFLVQLN